MRKLSVNIKLLTKRMNKLKGIKKFWLPPVVPEEQLLRARAVRSLGASSATTKSQTKSLNLLGLRLEIPGVDAAAIQKLVASNRGQILKKLQGKIGIYGPKPISRAFREQFGYAPKTRAGRRGLRTTLIAHEQAERAVRPRDMLPAYVQSRGHVSPEVLLKEHNLLSRLTGPGSGEAIKAMRNMRRETGETAELAHALRETFGGDPRAARFLKPGTKIPKAMRKRYLQIVRGNRDKGIDAQAEINRKIPDMMAGLQRLIRGS